MMTFHAEEGRRDDANLHLAGLPTAAVIAVTTVLFAVVHLPFVELTLATTVLGGVFTAIYLKWRNLWPLGLWHGWLAALFYLWFLRLDPSRLLL